MPSGIISLGYSNLFIIGGFVACSGIITLLAGSIIGLLSIRKGSDDKSVLWLALNGSFLVGFVGLIAAGFVIQQSEDKKKAERFAKYNAERNDSRIEDAKKLRKTYFKNITDEKIMVIMTGKIGDNLGIAKVGEYTLISLPTASGGEGDKAVNEIMSMAKYYNKFIVKEFLENGDRDGLNSIMEFYKKNDETFSYNNGNDYIFVKDVNKDLWEKKDEVIQGIKSELSMLGLIEE